MRHINLGRFILRRKLFTIGPDEKIFRRLFRHLLLWYVSILAVLVMLFVLSIGTSVPWLVFVSASHDLSTPLAQFARSWQQSSLSPCVSARPSSGYMLACYDAHGRLLGSQGINGATEQHFLESSLALNALHEQSAVQDALDESGEVKVHFDFVFLNTARPGMVRQAVSVKSSVTHKVLGVVQLGSTPEKTLAIRQVIVNMFFILLGLGLLVGVPLGGWYMASKTLLPARLAFQRQRDFIANVSHELGTPLALLRANAEVLLRSLSALSPDDAALLEDIVAETSYMDKLTSNMLLLARMDAGQLTMDAQPINLGELTNDITRRAQALARRSGIVLTAQVQEAVWTSGDPLLLEQALLILLDNALKYTPAGGKVTLSAFNESNVACLRITDTGQGIAPNDLSRLGERFYRADKAHSSTTGGSGLGLSIVYGLMTAHAGSLTLTSELAKGTSATLSLPTYHK